MFPSTDLLNRNKKSMNYLQIEAWKERKLIKPHWQN